MTKEEHYEQYRLHNDKCIAAISRCAESFNVEDWEEYLRESKLYNKHYGIYRAMCTKERKRAAV